MVGKEPGVKDLFEHLVLGALISLTAIAVLALAATVLSLIDLG